MSISNPRLLQIFFDKYNPIPVDFDFVLSLPVNPFSKTLIKSDSFIPQPLSLIVNMTLSLPF